MALPTIREKDGALDKLNILHMGANGLLSFSGGPLPFLIPRFWLNDAEVLFTNRLKWYREKDWLPKFKLQEGPVELEGVYFCPPGERGFILSLKVSNESDSTINCNLAVDTQLEGTAP